MELAEGRSLRELIREGALQFGPVLRSISGVLAGLEYAHQRSVIHRDISPSNIIVTEDGIPKLMDFGLSKVVAEPGLGQSGVVLGTVYYCSPEQVKGSTNLDSRSDIYSLGVVLYEALTGRRPFESETAFNIMMDHVDTPPVPPSDLNPAIPHVLNDIVLKAMAKRPEDRFQSAGEFHRALDIALRLLDAELTPQRVRKPSVWHSLAEDCVRLTGRRTVQIGLVALGLAFPVTVVSINVAGYGATSPAPPAVTWAAPPVPAGALQLSSLTPAASPSRETGIPRKSIVKPAAVSLNADRSAPESLPASTPLAEPVPTAADPVETTKVADAADPQPQGDPQHKNSVKRFFGKVFHRKAKLTPAANDAGEQAAQGADPSR
jgi:serine/threonine-protein kinase